MAAATHPAVSVVLVTGSSSGIGLATARRFAERGDSVVFNSAHSVEAGEHASDTTPGSHYVPRRYLEGRRLHATRGRGSRALRSPRHSHQQRGYYPDDPARRFRGGQPRRMARDLRGQRFWHLATQRGRNECVAREPRIDRERLVGRRAFAPLDRRFPTPPPRLRSTT